MEKVFVSWSGGKDSCFAAYLAGKNGLDVSYLLNMVKEDGIVSWSHHMSSAILQAQARASGLPLVQQKAPGPEYEPKFVSALNSLKAKELSGGVFGDIDFQPHRDWVENVCKQAGMTAHLPLWGLSQDRIMDDFIAAGFEAVVVVTKADLMGKEWLGRKVDGSFIKDLNELAKSKPVTPCGEAGEYHTLVVDGPIFQKRLDLLQTQKVFHDGYWFLDINEYKLTDNR